MPRSRCSICSKTISDGDLCQECGSELADASPEALAHYVASLKRVSPVATPAPPVSSSPPPTSVTVTDPRIPAPEFVATLRAQGLTAEQIAAELQISVSQTQKLLTAGRRSELFQATREWAAKRFIPKILANIDRALNTDGDASLSMQLAKDLGIWQAPSEAPSEPVGEDETFESWKISVTKKTKNVPERADITVTPIEANPPADEGTS